MYHEMKNISELFYIELTLKYMRHGKNNKML